MPNFQSSGDQLLIGLPMPSGMRTPSFLDEDECAMIAEDFHDSVMKKLGGRGTLAIFPESRTNQLLENSRSRARQLADDFDVGPDFDERRLETHETLRAVGKDGSTYKRDHTQSQDQQGEKHVIV
jgi:hypothetical protein